MSFLRNHLLHPLTAVPLVAALGLTKSAAAQDVPPETQSEVYTIKQVRLAETTQGLQPEQKVLLDQIANQKIYTLQSGSLTRDQIQSTVDSIYNTGYFQTVEAKLELHPDQSYTLVYELIPNPVVQEIQVNGITALPETVIKDVFQDIPVVGILNQKEVDKAVVLLQNWYQNRGYSLARLKSQTVVDNKLVLQFDEGKILDIDFQFLNRQGRPTKGRTQQKLLLAGMKLLPGQIYQEQAAKLNETFFQSLNLFSQIQSEIVPMPDGTGYILRYYLQETQSRFLNIGANVGDSPTPGLSFSYEDRNLAGLKNELGIEMLYRLNGKAVGSVRYVNPFLTSNLGLTVSTGYGFTSSPAFQGGKLNVPTRSGGDPIIETFRFQMSFPMYLSRNWQLSPWVAFRNASIQSSLSGTSVNRDILGNRLTATGQASELLALVGLRLQRDTRNDSFLATRGSLLRWEWEQSLGLSGVFYGKAILDASIYIPIPALRWAQRTGAIALGGSLGLSYGNLPPYEAFVLGGSDTVRGWNPYEIASSRHYGLVSAELRIPLPLNLYGALFIDAASDLGSQATTPGKPGLVRQKPGSGIGFGVGLRFLQQRVALDWGWNNQGTSAVSISGRLRF